MSNELIATIVSNEDHIRNRSIGSLLNGLSSDMLLRHAAELEQFRTSTPNLYHKVRASLFLYVLYRFHLQKNDDVARVGTIPFNGIKAAFSRDFEKAVDIYNESISSGEKNSAVFSAIAEAYHKLSFQYLLDQVKLSISSCRENHHLYHINTLDDYPFITPNELTAPDAATGNYPVGMDASPVRLDPSHSGWSDIFFLGMDFPEGAKVINMSVNLKVRGTDGPLIPPCECYCRFIDEPVIRLTSIDLDCSKDISDIKELFNFGNDHLSLLKAGVVASGLVPPCFEHKDIQLTDILQKLLAKQGGIELVTKVNGIPKGSRLAVSTTLLAVIITRLMRFSGQISNQTGSISNTEKRIAASRAILGEWLGGSGGGWQDSGGIWPGIKIINGIVSNDGDPEFGVSRGCLLPEHKLFSREDLSDEVEKKITDSLVLVHGGISQNVGPVLEMVTEKYLLKHDREWNARLKSIELFEKITEALISGDMKLLGRLTTEDWDGPLKEIIPWVNNAFTETLIKRAKEQFSNDLWGFLMLGGMSGGGMAFIVNPDIRDTFKKGIFKIMNELKQTFNFCLPFIIDPVVYDFEINHEGIIAKLFKGQNAVMPGPAADQNAEDNNASSMGGIDPEQIKMNYGFDERSHEHMKQELKNGNIGLAENRLPPDTDIRDIEFDEIMHYEDEVPDDTYLKTGIRAIENSEAAVVTFAGGMGSRWSQGAAVIKPINPFINIGGRYRTFIESHLAKSRHTGKMSGTFMPHVFTTSYLTHNAISDFLNTFDNFGYEGSVYLSPSRSIGHRVYPMIKDLRFYWEEQLQQKLDDNQQKVLDDIHNSLIEWTASKGEGNDYTENRGILRFNPPGHWYEVPNLIKNGVLAELLREDPGLKYLFCHNIDTMGASVDPVILGMHMASDAAVTFEVTPRRIEDAGGGLARVNGHMQLIEGLALPHEEDEYRLSYYNTLTSWITIDPFLEFFGLSREILLKADHDSDAQEKIEDAVRNIEQKIKTYITIKNVKYIWGSGQEDMFPVAQFEKLWGDMTGLKDLKAGYISVSRYRGLQLKEPSLLDTWANDGSLEYVKMKSCF